MQKKAPLLLMILDGWGYNENNQYNAIAQAKTPQWDEWWEKCPHILLQASGDSVGLPDAQMGNSEVGHMHIGAGRVIEQDFTRINKSIANGEFAENPVFHNVLTTLQKTKKTLHIMGLFSPGGVHSHEQHLFALLDLCAQQKFTSVYLHLFLDGRDTPPQSALPSLERLDAYLRTHPIATIASISGRYYAMDRDNRWDRIEQVYNLLTQSVSKSRFADAETAIKSYYLENLSDEFIPPTQIGEPHPMKDGDAVLFFNFRADRARQLTTAFLDPEFNKFNRTKNTQLSYFVSMTQYDKNLPTTAAFPPIHLNNTLGEVLAAHGLSQLRIAETEKYAHVTFFFNGGNENVFPHEERVLIPSPKIATYNLQPEMSAPQLTDHLVAAINSHAYDVIICNYANADMVGHSGDFAATVSAIECLDRCMSQVWHALAKQGGQLLITADHGNAEEMFDEKTHQAHTAHTSEPVPLVYVGGPWHFTRSEGGLTDIAPTMLTLLGITPPTEMTGHSLLEKNIHE
ncbi:2,3-bisphosphoglycerate-independent phosphoglycerate mutase [Legionella longbeachae]|uniref:2,3-bisphosphoglycerate-independent phosphoglycerate mutase n=1 Tax=Legionella longbeachae serogroup 1 (strain NSW150) TaxID=661367 RepID=D3HL03_LEGLN|nr:2,3-bisphosphoglycerate-independent phosphoglycerate mutase [Legionella longbeachae]VEE03630.1 phosphoglycerate mutases [Legionella oakridgensis]HBD7397564.1 2,3-bisphosphoglycerate-independent phosphoglycerate mutase [Legionella pneumophila]ARB93485.1 2,3-bisphosphoglycerate-independent phosphoglycerate mutase [Legionella longbeachae]ARM33410.1 2,3-bisphosphoglycerate-independent phosphoglycerate mutase [Legionella longbeachae]EEZ93746.1 2,3-bisphosphoglycerate-independent phosphoglycerate